MPYGLYLSAEGAHAQSERLAILANNLANADTVGFKRDVPVFQARYAEAIERGQTPPGMGGLEDIGGGIELRETKIDFAPGPLKATGSPKDLALDGDGFFQVQKGNEILLTRAGNFSINANNQLVTQQGYPVLSESGSPVSIESESPWQFTPQGNLVQSGENTPLAIVRAASRGDLAKVGENLFRPLAPPQAVPAEQRRVATGHLEGSSVRPALEMMELIETSRAFEANVNMIKHQDQAIGNLISRVLKD